MVGFTVGPLPGQDDFGAVVTGLTPESLDDPATRTALYDLWIDKGVLVFKGLSGLDTQLKLSAIFGEPEEPPLLRGVNQKRSHQIIADVEYDPEDGDIYEIEGELIGGYLPWHFDSAYNAEINRGGVLRPHVLPGRGGQTGFIDQIAAYDWLPEELKAAIEGVNVILYAHDGFDEGKVRREAPPLCPPLVADAARRDAPLTSAPVDPSSGLHPGGDRSESAQCLALACRRHRGPRE